MSEKELVERQYDPAPMEGITDFQAMHVRHVGGHEFRVLNLDSDTIAEVNLGDMTCTCEDMQYNRDGNREVCKHVAIAHYKAPQARIGVEEQLVGELGQTVREMQDAKHALESASKSAESVLGAAHAEREDGSEAAEDDAEDEELVEDAHPSEADQQLMTSFEQWLNEAQQFNADIDPEIVALEWVEVEGSEGIHVDRAPWYAGDGTYWDDDESEWADKDAYEDARDAVGDLLSNQDETEWFGDPDYVWFVPADKVSEVVG